MLCYEIVSKNLCMSRIRYVCLELRMFVWHGIHKLLCCISKPDWVTLGQACSHSNYRGARKSAQAKGLLRTQLRLEPSSPPPCSFGQSRPQGSPSFSSHPQTQEMKKADATLRSKDLGSYCKGSFCTEYIFISYNRNYLVIPK